jgi:RNA polymerase sigma-70 factor (ECF subfamily)
MSDADTDLADVLQAHRPRFLRFLTARLGSPEEAEDVLQDVWMKLARTAPSGPIADPVAYIFRVVDNAARDRKRTAARRRALDERWRGPEDETSIETESPPTPEEIAIARSRLRRVEAVLDGMPERTRYIFRACRIDGQPQKALAAELGISVSGVEKHLQRAYKAVAAIQRAIEDAETGEA